MLGLTIAGLAMLAASVRVIGWILVAATLAGLLHPAVGGLTRWMRRGLALVVVVLVCLAIAGFIAYRVVDDINTQLHELQGALPRAARSIEQSEQFGKSARQIHLATKVRATSSRRACAAATRPTPCVPPRPAASRSWRRAC
jgi:predicted PurR-regulated permease PerM